MKQDKSKRKRPYSNNKGRDNNKKGGYRKDEPKCKSEEEQSVKGTNDLSWYVSNEQILKDVASLPFSQMSGSPFKWTDTPIPAISNPVDATLPGVMRFNWIPTYGTMEGRTSNVNVAATNIYTFVRHQNSGSANYDSPDLMLYLLAMDNIYASLSSLRRMYKLARTYSVRNRYFPRGVLYGAGLNDVGIEALFTRLAEFRYRINSLILKASTLCVPNTMPIFQRHMYMSENVYMDTDNDKAQIYMFMPRAFYKFNEVEGSGKLVMFDAFHGDDPISHCLDCEAMLDKILSSEDMNIMSGDILKAYGPDHLVKLNLLEENELIIPIYDREMLMQIENMKTTNGVEAAFWDGTHDIEQNETKDSLLQNLTLLDDDCADCIAMKPLINMRWENVLPGDVMIASRLCTAWEGSRATSQYTIYPGSEVITRIIIFNNPGSFLSNSHIKQFRPPLTNGLYEVALCEEFDWHPFIYGWTTIDSAQRPYYLGDVSNFSVVSNTTLRNMHNAATLALFGV